MIFPTAILSSRRGGILVLFLSAGVVISCSRRDHQASRSDLSDARIDIVTFVSASSIPKGISMRSRHISGH